VREMVKDLLCCVVVCCLCACVCEWVEVCVCAYVHTRMSKGVSESVSA